MQAQRVTHARTGTRAGLGRHSGSGVPVSLGAHRRCLDRASGFVVAAAADRGFITGQDLSLLSEAAKLSTSSIGLTQPHPNAACILVGPNGSRVGAAHQRAQGTMPAEVLAAQQAKGAAQGATAYLNLESGDCHGDEHAVAALVAAGVKRVVVGLRHPLAHLRNKALAAYAAGGLEVSVLGDTPVDPSLDPAAAEAALLDCLAANEPLLHRAVLKRPLSILKYAMTLDGKIATAMGHSAWVSSAASRARVFQMRAHSDVVIVGGNTVRRDNPRLTTRQEGGHMPARMVMSRTLDLPADANLWDVDSAPTIVMTQRGARASFQALLRARGVEVVEFDFLTPENVADYCYERGFLQVFWECGGTLAAPAIAGGIIHKLMAFVAPKIIGGTRAPTPVGELGNVEMTQAVNLVEPRWEQVGPDLMIQGYLPSSGGLLPLEAALSYPGRKAGALPSGATATTTTASSSGSSSSSSSSSAGPSGSGSSSWSGASSSSGSAAQQQQQQRNRNGQPRVLCFYKAWDEWGSFSNFSPHPITMPAAGSAGAAAAGSSSSSSSSSSSGSGAQQEWASVEHFYQAQKFAGNPASAAANLVAAIAAAPSPEEAARIGRRAERQHPELLTPGWGEAKRGVMLGALRAKFRAHAGPRDMLLSTAGDGVEGGEVAAELVESSPHDHYWGQGYTGAGRNTLGQLLMQVREELMQEAAAGSSSSSSSTGRSLEGQWQIQQQQEPEQGHGQQQGVLLGNGHAQHMVNGRQQQQQQQQSQQQQQADAGGRGSPVASL